MKSTPTIHAWQKKIQGKQIAVFWHVDDLEVSHVYPKEVTNFMEWLEGIYRD